MGNRNKNFLSMSLLLKIFRLLTVHASEAEQYDFRRFLFYFISLWGHYLTNCKLTYSSTGNFVRGSFCLLFPAQLRATLLGLGLGPGHFASLVVTSFKISETIYILFLLSSQLFESRKVVKSHGSLFIRQLFFLGFKLNIERSTILLKLNNGNK
jgi:hypothetical protein